ncbi:MAG: YqaJ viral recombinase family protein [Candidatus Omnitrophota bacterium]
MLREEWLKNRITMIGGSDASAILGMNPYKSNLDVWREKTGRVIPEDIGSRPYVQYGIRAEQYLTSLFALDYPAYQVKANMDFTVYRHPKYPFIGGTLDGELLEKETGRRGILEVKTTEILNSMHREKWNDKIPDNYYIQVLHYLLATGWDFAILKAQLKTVYNCNDVRLNTRHYFVDRADVKEDLEYLLEQEIEFWGFIESEKMPPLTLPII